MSDCHNIISAQLTPICCQNVFSPVVSSQQSAVRNADGSMADLRTCRYREMTSKISDKADLNYLINLKFENIPYTYIIEYLFVFIILKTNSSNSFLKHIMNG